ALKGHGAVTRILLQKGSDLNARSYDGKSALHLAVSEGHEEVSRLLLERGADFLRAYNGRTALYWAAKSGNRTIMQLLLEEAAKVNLKGNKISALVRAALEKGNEDLVQQLLLGNGLNVNAEREYGGTVLTSAA